MWQAMYDWIVEHLVPLLSGNDKNNNKTTINNSHNSKVQIGNVTNGSNVTVEQNITIDLTEKKYVSLLESKIEELKDEKGKLLDLLNDEKSDKKDTQRQLTEVFRQLGIANDRLANKDTSYQQIIKELQERIDSLSGFGVEVSQEIITDAMQYLAKGQIDEADKVFDEIIKQEEEAIKKRNEANKKGNNSIALAYYQKAHIANDKLNFNQALVYFEKAVAYNHDEWQYQLWAGNLAQDVGDYAKAQKYLEEARDIAEKNFPPPHPYYATSLHNLATLYKAQGLYKKAEPLYQEALEITKDALGKDHPDYATYLNNLAGLYQDQGLYKKAEPLHQEALEINKKSLGKSHPSYATSLNNLAELYQAQGLYDQAEPLLKEALEITQNALGEKHPHTQTVRENLTQLQNIIKNK